MEASRTKVSRRLDIWVGVGSQLDEEGRHFVGQRLGRPHEFPRDNRESR